MSKKEEKCIELITNKVKDGMTVVDIGACLGFYTKILSNLVGDRGEVYAIEPVPANVENIKILMQQHNLHNVKLSQSAISDTIGEVEMLQHKTLPWMGHLAKSNTTKTPCKNRVKAVYTPIIANSYTLDTFQEKYNIGHIDFIKIDIEGGEVYIFDGMSKVLSQDHLIIYLEMHFTFMDNPLSSVNSIMETISDYGLCVTALVDKANNIWTDINNADDVLQHQDKGIVYIFLEK